MWLRPVAWRVDGGSYSCGISSRHFHRSNIIATNRLGTIRVPGLSFGPVNSERRVDPVSHYALIELTGSEHQKLPREFDPKNQGGAYGKYLLARQEELEELALKAGVQPVSSCMDDFEMLDEDARKELGLGPAEPR